MAHNCNRLRTAHILCAVATLSTAPTLAQAEEPPPTPSAAEFLALPLPPPIEGLIGLPQTYTKARSAYLDLITREAEQKGLPPALADAVVKVESGFKPFAVGGVGEVGLMQVRPETAAMLGYPGGATGLFDPETNVRLGVTYLARAWQLANGDVCRALMKYRAGWGEERMTPLSVEYCRRARGHLAAIGSPLAQGAEPLDTAQARTLNIKPPVRLAPLPKVAASRLLVRVISFQPATSSALTHVKTAASTRINASELEKVLAAQAG